MRTPDDIQDFYLGLAPSKNDDVFPLSPLHGNAFMTKRPSGNIALAFVLDTGGVTERTFIFHGVSLRTFCRAAVKISSGTELRPLAVVECVEQLNWRIFAVLAAEVESLLETTPSRFRTATQVTDYIDTWSEMFRPSRPMSAQEKIGLWGELETLTRGMDLDAMVDAWHGCRGACFDFSNNGIHLETKTSMRGPVHRFSLEQLVAPGSGEVYIASLQIAEDMAAGSTLQEQVDLIAERIKDPIAFEKRLIQRGFRKDTESGKFSLLSLNIYRGDQIPHPIVEASGISEVNFTSDLTGLTPLSAPKTKGILERLTAPQKKTSRKKTGPEITPNSGVALKRAVGERLTVVTE